MLQYANAISNNISFTAYTVDVHGESETPQSTESGIDAHKGKNIGRIQLIYVYTFILFSAVCQGFWTVAIAWIYILKCYWHLSLCLHDKQTH